jgi:hypothetical protein
MLDELAVFTRRAASHETRRGRVAAEFPSIYVHFEIADDPQSSVALLRSSQWRRRDFDTWAFDCALDELAAHDSSLVVEDDADDADRDFAMEVLNRCQRHIERRNRHSQGPSFTRVLQHHRAKHDLSLPLVRADFNHALDVWQWVLRLDREASLPLQLAALFHDIERLASEPEVRVEHLADDYQKFKDAHAKTGAEMTNAILAAAGVAEQVRDRVTELIAAHERPSSDAEVALLNDADALSFFSLNSPGYADYFGPEQTRRKVAYTWNRMGRDARGRLQSIHVREDVRQMLMEV